MTDFTRARLPEQKEERRAHLLSTARALLDAGTPLNDLGMNALARAASMTKSNVYRYFESREAVLLELLHDEWLAWYQTLTTTWTAPPTASTTTLRAMCAHFAHTLAQRPLLCLLTSALPSVLEQNVSEDIVRAFKHSTLDFFVEVGVFIGEIVPALRGDPAVALMQDGAVILAGLWPHAHPAEAVRHVVATTPALRVFAPDFEADFARLLHAVAVESLSLSS